MHKLAIRNSYKSRIFHLVAFAMLTGGLGSCSDEHESQSNLEIQHSALSGTARSNPEKLKRSFSGAGSAERAASVIVAVVSRVESKLRRHSKVFTSATNGIREAKVDAKRPGRIVSVDVALGEDVDVGQTLIRLDSLLEQLAVDAAVAAQSSAEAGKDKADRDLQRAQELFAESGISKSRLESVQLAAKIARSKHGAAIAELGAARRHLAETRIIAPFAGEISQLPYEVGETPLFAGVVAEVTDRTELLAEVFLTQEEAQTISVGMEAVISVAGDTMLTRQGIMRALSPKGNEATKLFKGEVVIENHDLYLRAGVTCNVSFLIGATNFPLVPLDAIIEPEGVSGTAYVVVVKNGAADGSGAVELRASFRKIILGDRIGVGVSIISGLEFGERIVVKGAQSLSDNQLLREPQEVPLDSLFH